MKIWNAMLMRIVSTVATVETNFMALFSKSDGLYFKIGSVEQKVLTTSSPISSLSNVSTATPSTGDVLRFDGSIFVPSDVHPVNTVNITGSVSLVLSAFEKTVVRCSSFSSITVTLDVSNIPLGGQLFISYTSTSSAHRTCVLTLSIGLKNSQSFTLTKTGTTTAIGAKYMTEVIVTRGLSECQILGVEKTY